MKKLIEFDALPPDAVPYALRFESANRALMAALAAKALGKADAPDGGAVAALTVRRTAEQALMAFATGYSPVSMRGVRTLYASVPETERVNYGKTLTVAA